MKSMLSFNPNSYTWLFLDLTSAFLTIQLALVNTLMAYLYRHNQAISQSCCVGPCFAYDLTVYKMNITRFY